MLTGLRTAKLLLVQISGIVGLIVLWQFWVAARGLNTIVLPGPMSVVLQLLNEPAVYFWNGLHTLALALAGLALGTLLGTTVAVVAWSSRLFEGILTPLGLIFSSVPIVALIPVIARILGYDVRTELAIVILISFFPLFVFTLKGLKALPPGASDLFQTLGATKRQHLAWLALPASLPSWLTGFRIAAPHAVLAAIVAEFLMGTSGLGHVLEGARSDLQMQRALAASLSATVISVTFFLLSAVLEQRLLRNR